MLIERKEEGVVGATEACMEGKRKEKKEGRYKQSGRSHIVIMCEKISVVVIIKMRFSLFCGRASVTNELSSSSDMRTTSIEHGMSNALKIYRSKHIKAETK